MKGYRTIITNILLLIFALAATYGFDIGVEEQTSITMGVMAVANIVLRVVTTTKAGKQE